MSNPLAKNYSFWGLIKYTLPTIVMMIFMSMYTMVDGMFVSRLIGTDALSAVNIVYPVQSVLIAISIMFATGGSAIIATKMGENKPQEAKENFTLIVVAGVIIAIVFSILNYIFLDKVLVFLGANQQIYDYCYQYAFTLNLFFPLSMLQMLFQFFFVTAGKPNLGLILTLFGGIANIILDYVCIEILNMGISGAAFATGVGFSIPAVFGMIYFTLNKKAIIHYVKPKLDFKMLLEACSNGFSEMVTNLATAITTLIFNVIMMKLMGADGVASITIVLYSQFLLSALYLGYSSGIAPLFSYNYGSQNFAELKNLFNISKKFLIISSIATVFLAIIFAPVLTSIFATPNSNVYNISISGFKIFAYAYLFMGTNIFASSMFTALSNGRVSAIISFARTFLFLVPLIYLLPMFFDINGVWISVPLAEAISMAVSLWYIIKLKNQYLYLD